MHELYVQKYEQNAKKPLDLQHTLFEVHTYFNENVNITFDHPRIDMFGKCDQLEAQLAAASAPLKIGIRKQKEDTHPRI